MRQRQSHRGTVFIVCMLMCDGQVQYQRHRTRHIQKVGSQLNVHTSLTPDPSHLLSFNLVCCAKEVSDLISLPIVSILGTRVGDTSAQMVSNWNSACTRKFICSRITKMRAEDKKRHAKTMMSRKPIEVLHNFRDTCCLFLSDKAKAKQKTYVLVSLR